MKKPLAMPDEEMPVDEKMPVEEAMPPEGEMMDEPPADGGELRATPEEQELKDKFVAQGFMLMYGKEAASMKIAEMLEGGGDPVSGLATAAALIISRVYMSADSSGIEMPADVVWQAGQELFEDLAALSGKLGIKDFAADQDAFEGAFLRAADETRTMMQEAGKLDKEAASADMAKLKEMDDAGELEQKFMGLAERDDAGMDEEPPEETPEPGRGLGKMVGAM